MSDKMIDTIDPDGVALAAIQGLNDVVHKQGAQLAEKGGEIEELRGELAALREQVGALVTAWPL